MNSNDIITYGVVGTAVSATGAGLSVTELQAIISIIITILGFLISVIIPLVIKLVRKIKEIKKDGKVTDEEVQEVIDILNEGASEMKRSVEDKKDN